MNPACFTTLATLSAARPVALIIIGAFLLLTAWRIHQRQPSVAAKVLLLGSAFIAFNYCLLLPAYSAQWISAPEALVHNNKDPRYAYLLASIRDTGMNVGWFILGMGLVILPRVKKLPEGEFAI